MTDQRLVQHGFNNIEIEKGKLLKIIKDNRETHIAEYEKSVKSYEAAKLAYAQEFWAQLSENVGLVKTSLNDKVESVADAVLTARETFENGGVIDLRNVNAIVNQMMNIVPKVQMSVKQPVSHEKDYDVAIRGLELSTAEYVFLDHANFQQYVLDEWNWKADFSNNNSVLFSGVSMIGNSYFNNNPHGLVMTSGCFVEKFGDTMMGPLVMTTGTAPSKSSQLFNSIITANSNS